MMTPHQQDPVLRDFRAALDAVYGDEIARVVLYGSRARGDARVDSDYDVAVFLKNVPDRWKEIYRLADIEADFIWKSGAVIHAMPFKASAYEESSWLMHEIRREGIDLGHSGHR